MGNPYFSANFILARALAISLGIGAAEIGGHLLLNVTPLVLAHDHHAFTADLPHTRDNGPVVTKATVSMQFAEVLDHETQVVLKQGALGVTGYLHGLPGGEVIVDMPQFGQLIFL